MAVIAWPSTLKVSEIQIGVAPPSRGSFGTVNRYPQFSAHLSEVWAGQIALAAVGQSDKRDLELFLARLQGRLNTFELPPPGVWAGEAVAGITTEAASAGAGEVVLSRPVRAGDIIKLTSGETTQVVEAAKSGASVAIAPRLRYDFPAGTTFEGPAAIPFRLAADDAGVVQTILRHGVCTLAVVEAI